MLTKNRKNGSALSIVIVVAISIGTLALSYFRLSGNFSENKNRNINKTLVKEISEIALAEAFNKIKTESQKTESKVFEILKSPVGSVLDLNLNYAKECVEKLIPEGFSAEITGKMKIVDFSKISPNGKNYYGTHEGNGILAIEIIANLYKTKGFSYKLTSSYKIEEFHDYIIASAVCMGENGSKLLNSLIVRQSRETGEKETIKEKNSILSIEKSPDSYQPVLPDKVSFYDEPTLWHKRNMTFSALQKQGYLDINSKTINLNGIVHCCENITLNGDWKAKGQGVIIADSFNINGAIEKSDNNAICVLYARKNNIKIETSKPINAALIAINDKHTGTLEASKILNLNGAVVVDIIDISNWPEGDHKISYDRIFKNDENANRIAVSDWINYRKDDDRLSENENNA